MPEFSRRLRLWAPCRRVSMLSMTRRKRACGVVPRLGPDGFSFVMVCRGTGWIPKKRWHLHKSLVRGYKNIHDAESINNFFFISLSFSSDIHRVGTSGSSVLLCNNHTTITPHTAIFICLQNISHCSSKYPWWLTHFMSNIREILHFSSTKPILPLLCRYSNCPGNYILI